MEATVKITEKACKNVDLTLWLVILDRCTDVYCPVRDRFLTLMDLIENEDDNKTKRKRNDPRHIGWEETFNLKKYFQNFS